MSETIAPSPPLKRFGWTLAPDANWPTVPFYRKRWLVVLAVIVFVPLALLIMFTGGVYFEKRGGVYAMPLVHKILITVLVVVGIAVNLSR